MGCKSSPTPLHSVHCGQSCGVPEDAGSPPQWQAVSRRLRQPAITQAAADGTGARIPLFPTDIEQIPPFDPSNIELTVKLLDGTAINGHWWVYWSHMTSLEVWLEVTDTETGKVVIYTAPARDTSAFPGL